MKGHGEMGWISKDSRVKWMKGTCTCRAGLAGLVAWTTLACAGGIGRMAWDVTGDWKDGEMVQNYNLSRKILGRNLRQSDPQIQFSCKTITQ